MEESSQVTQSQIRDDSHVLEDDDAFTNTSYTINDNSLLSRIDEPVMNQTGGPLKK